MTLNPLGGRFRLNLLTPSSTSDVNREEVSVQPRCNFVGRLILVTHSSKLGKGPEESLPSLSIAYQPDLMLRMSDLSSPT
jgi:hypothetical protein